MKFNEILTNWYSVNKRDLPWRHTTNPYCIWLSEIILQQTQVKQGTPYYHAFLENFPTVFHLAQASEDQVLKLWQGLGYYSRARNLHASAKYIVNDLNGVFPNTYKDLLKLKGVGDYTASAVASIAFNACTAVVDGNVYRVLSRCFGISTPINSTKGIKEFKLLAQELISKKDPATFNQAIMEFGATQCTPKNPSCHSCPFNTTCVALQKKVIEVLPVKIKSAKAKKKYFNFLVFLFNNNKTILEQREGKGIWQNLYQFPLLETSSPAQHDAVKAHLLELPVLKNMSFDLSLYSTKAVVHKLSHQHLHTHFWIINVNAPLKHGVLINDVKNYAVPVLISNFIDAFNF